MGATAEAGATVNLGICFRNTGRFVEAIALVNLGHSWLILGDRRRARDALDASMAICREIGTRHPEGYALRDLSALADEEGDTKRAWDFADNALALRRAIGHGDGIADSQIQRGAYTLRAGDQNAARAALEEAAALSRDHHKQDCVAEALALLANLPDGDAEAAEAALQEAGNTPQTRYHLWKATGEREHLEETKRLLDYRVEHAPEEYRESMIRNVRLNREIMEAWVEHGPRTAS